MNENMRVSATTTFEATPCAHCGRLIETEEEVGIDNGLGEVYCEDCVTICEHCGESVPVDEIIHLNATVRWLPTRHYCPRCAEDHGYRCRDCDEWFTPDGIWDFYDSEPVCHDCESSDRYVRCATCGEVILRDYANYDEDRDDHFCNEHYHPQTRHLHGYGHLQMSREGNASRFLKMEGEVDTRLFYGVELEIDKGDSRDEVVDDLYEVSEGETLFMCKTDGSLDDGVEIVSNPMSFGYAMEKFPFEDISRIAKLNGFRSHDAGTCGLHIHVSREGLGDTELKQDLVTAKMMIIFDRYWQKMVRFSRRNGYQLDRWAQQSGVFYTGMENEPEEDIARKAKTKVYEAGRYQAINLQNRHTVEFRLFRGTLNVDTILATIQLLDVMIDFAKRTSLKEVIKAEWADIVRSDYKELNDYLTRRGLFDSIVDQDGGDDEDGNE